MKLPSLKLPAFKLPKLGGGLLARFSKKKDDDEIAVEDIEADALEGIDVDAAEDVARADAEAGEADAPEEEAGGPRPTMGGMDDDEDDLEDLDDAPNAVETGGGRKKLIIIAGAAALLLAFVVGGAGWFLFSGDDGGDVTVVEGAGDADGSATGSGMIERSAAVVPPPSGPEGVPRVVAPLPPRGAAGLMTLPGGVAPAAPAAGTALDKGIGVEDPQLGLVVAAVTPASFVGIPDLPASEPLPIAPLPGLFEDGDHGMLPRIGPDGKTPLAAYARPFKGAADLLRVAIIIKELGLNRATTNAAIRKLPPAVTMAFSPYAQGVGDWARFARERGHETLIELPLEPREFPVLDPGPYALRTLSAPADNQRLLEFTMGRASGYVGLIGVMGSKYNKNREQLSATLTHLKARGIMFVDGTSGEGSLAPKVATQLSLPRAVVDINLDRVSSRTALEAGLARAVETARKKSVAVVAVDPTPVAIEALTKWIETLEGQGLVLAPISALADKQLF